MLRATHGKHVLFLTGFLRPVSCACSAEHVCVPADRQDVRPDHERGGRDQGLAAHCAVGLHVRVSQHGRRQAVRESLPPAAQLHAVKTSASRGKAVVQVH